MDMTNVSKVIKRCTALIEKYEKLERCTAEVLAKEVEQHRVNKKEYKWFFTSKVKSTRATLHKLGTWMICRAPEDLKDMYKEDLKLLNMYLNILNKLNYVAAKGDYVRVYKKMQQINKDSLLLGETDTEEKEKITDIIRSIYEAYFSLLYMIKQAKKQEKELNNATK